MKKRLYSVVSVFLAIIIITLCGTSVTANAAGVTFTADISMTSVYVGAKVTVTAQGHGGTAPYYYKMQYKVGNGSWNVFNNYSASNTASFTMSTAGEYTVRITVKDKNGKESNPGDTSFTAKIKYSALQNNSAITSNSVNLGNSITIKASASGGTAPYQYLYQYQLYDGSLKTAKNWSNSSNYQMKLPSAGYYTIKCTVKDSNGTTCAKSFDVTVNNTTNTALTNTSSVSSYAVQLGNTIKVNGSATGGSQPYMYSFYYQVGSELIKVSGPQKRSYANINLPNAGEFLVRCIITDTTGKNNSKDFHITVYNKTGNLISNQSYINTSRIVDQNTTVQINGKAAGGTQPYQYAYSYKLGNNTTYIPIKSYSNATSLNFDLSKIGSYTIKIDVKDYENRIVSKTITITTVSTSKASLKTRGTVIVSYGNKTSVSSSVGPSGTKYEFFYKKSDSIEWSKLKGYNSVHTIEFRPAELTDYIMLINKKTPNGVVTSERYLIKPEISSNMKTVLSLTNTERAKVGLKPLKLDYSLVYCAGIRSEELPKKYSHTRPDGSNCSTILKEYNIIYGGARGENIAINCPTPSSVMISWMASTDHKANILSDKFTNIGIGTYNGYWVQIFTNSL